LFLRRLSAPLALGREIVVGDVEGYVHFLSRENGAFIGRVSTDGSPIRSPLVKLENGFLVQTQDGNLYAMSTQ
jgi:outer membrane protein assembly factor BamB